jgi:hypothetical protein
MMSLCPSRAEPCKSSPAGLTRGSIKMMDCRVKPGNDELGMSELRIHLRMLKAFRVARRH